MPFAQRNVNRYSLGKVLYKTYFGRVQLAETEDGTTVVCKLSNRTLTSNARHDTLERPDQEVVFLEHFARQKHVFGGALNIIGLVESFQDATHDWIVLEYAAQGDMFDLVSSGKLKKSKTKDYFRQLVNGVALLHKHNIVHRDLSLENFFVTEEDIVKIGDFGQAKTVDVDEDGQVKELMNCHGGPKERPGKPGYMAPELFEDVPYDPKSADVFALGVALFVALTGIPPFNRADRSDKCWRYISQGNLQRLLNAWELNLDTQTTDLVQGMLNVEHKRLTLKQVMAHPFFDDADEVMTSG
jgi:5'-AMP-activated protein kinase catalytic alpha subunit